MPAINSHRCPSCDLTLPSGWGGYRYATNDEGERLPCGHPLEAYNTARITGLSPGEAEAQGRTGYISHCICTDCLHQFVMDLDKDIKTCPECESLRVKSVRGLIGETCPKCGDARIEEKFRAMS